ncbi:MAG: ParB/RepB/Spo0J family partition protein [Phycisphaerales bacterium]|nr:ParB/RepB/Spo0J family partition protein [Phycisphaerales bacterium]
MAKDPGRSSPAKPGLSKLGRGLGSLIPVPAQRPAVAVEPSRSVSAPAAAITTEPKPSTASGAAVGTPSATITSAATASESADPAGVRVTFIPVLGISPGAYQPRGQMDPAMLDALAASIAQSGLMQPIVVRRRGAGHELIAGERRWRAVQRLGWAEIPAIVQDVDDRQAAELALIENLQREDLNPMDRATALRRLSEEFGVSHQGLAERLGLDRSTVTNLLRLNELDAASAAHVRSGALTLGHAKVLMGITEVARRRLLADTAAAGGWSVRQLEQAVRSEGGVPRGTSSTHGRGAPSSAHVADLQRRLEEHLGTRVELRVGRRKGAGELRIHFHSLDAFDGLMQRIGFNPSKMSV